MQNGIHHLAVGNDQLDAGCHQQQRNARGHAANAFKQALTDQLAVGTRDPAGADAAEEKEQAHDRQCII